MRHATGSTRISLRPFRIADRSTQPVTVYRVEHGTSLIGPYNHDVEHGIRRDIDEYMRLVDGSGIGTHQPTARYDIPNLIDWVYRMNQHEDDYDPFVAEVLQMVNFRRVRFGFRTLADLRAWFGDSFLALSQEGYVIGKYEVAPIGVEPGGSQVAFHTDYAKRIGVVPYVDVMAGVPTLPRYTTQQTTLSL